MVTTSLLLLLLAIASVTDILGHKIYNWTTYSGILAAWGLSGLGAALEASGTVSTETLAHWGWIRFPDSFFGFLICGFVLVVCYVFLKVGGGDVKLMAMMGALLGLERGIEAMLWTFVLGGCLALVILIWRVGPLRLVTRVLRQLLWTIRLRWWSPLTAEEHAQLQLPLFLAPSALVATLIVQFSLIDYF
ncbi:MAG: A24 family peptidase [Thermoguttaceae bacterium]|jgi:prepilin peptidase CpaA